MNPKARAYFVAGMILGLVALVGIGAVVTGPVFTPTLGSPSANQIMTYNGIGWTNAASVTATATNIPFNPSQFEAGTFTNIKDGVLITNSSLMAPTILGALVATNSGLVTNVFSVGAGKSNTFDFKMGTTTLWRVRLTTNNFTIIDPQTTNDNFYLLDLDKKNGELSLSVGPEDIGGYVHLGQLHDGSCDIYLRDGNQVDILRWETQSQILSSLGTVAVKGALIFTNENARIQGVVPFWNFSGDSEDPAYAPTNVVSYDGLGSFIFGSDATVANGVFKGSVTATNLALTDSTNVITFAASTTAPVNTSTVNKWISVQIAGDTNAYKLPLYK